MAARGINIEMLGMPELQKKLSTLLPRVQKKVVRSALREAIQPVAAQAQRTAPVQSGLLQLAIKVMSRKFKDRNKFGIQVSTGGLSGAEIFYAAFNELGTRHQPARPFMRPALKDNEGAAKTILAKEIGDGIEREAMSDSISAGSDATDLPTPHVDNGAPEQEGQEAGGKKKRPIGVGKRGGRFRISASGRKVYLRRP